MKKIAVSIGDVNGIGLEIMLRSHEFISSICKPIYCIDEEVLKDSYKKIHIKYNINTNNIHGIKHKCKSIKLSTLITPGQITKESGLYSFESFKEAINLALDKKVDGIVTLPIHKKAWLQAGINFVGHTDYLSNIFNKKGIMMLGCRNMFVALFSDHIPLKDVPSVIKKDSLVEFLLELNKSINLKKVAVLGLNPHAGDGGVFGDEDIIIKDAIIHANEIINNEVFVGPISGDSAFNKDMRKQFSIFVAMYHDQGLGPLKTIYFNQSINITLGLPILRASVDHGVAFDIAYKNKNPKNTSYINAIKYIVNKK